LIHFKSVAFERDVTAEELTHWSLADLETLKAEALASHHHLEERCFEAFEREGFVPRSLQLARKFVHTFYLKVRGEYLAKDADAKAERSRAKAELELAKAQEISRRHQEHQLNNSRKNHMRNVIFFRLLKERFGDEIIEAIADEARELAEADFQRVHEAVS